MQCQIFCYSKFCDIKSVLLVFKLVLAEVDKSIIDVKTNNWDVAYTKYFEAHLAEIRLGRRNISWDKCVDCVLLVSHRTGIRRKQNNQNFEKSIGINVPSFSHVIGGSYWTYPQHRKFVGKSMYHPYTGNLKKQKDL